MAQACPSSVALAPLALAVALAFAAGCGRREQAALQSDAELIAFFHAHRSDLDSLRENCQATMRHGANDRDPVLWQQWTRLIGRLGLPGGGSIETTARIFIPAAKRPFGRDSIDTKGFAWLDSIMPRDALFDTLANLDSLDDRGLRRPARHVRHLEGRWWLYRWVEERASSPSRP